MSRLYSRVYLHFVVVAFRPPGARATATANAGIKAPRAETRTA